MGSKLTRPCFAAALITVSCVVLAASRARALDFKPERSASGLGITVSGEIKPGDAERLRQFLKKTQPVPTLVSLNSPGGSLGEGIRLGKLIRAQKLASVVRRGSECESACVFVLAGGVIREVERDAKVGVHMASLMFGNEYIEKLKRVLTDSQMDLDTKVRLIVSFNEQVAAQAMSLQAAYLQEMGVSLRLLFQIADTHHLKMKFLTLPEMKDLNLVNAE